MVGGLAAALVDLPLAEVSTKALFPLMAMFIGLTFSWAGNAHALLQSPEIRRATNDHPGGLAAYVFSFQLCILVLLVTMAAWVAPLLELRYFLPSQVGLDAFNALAEGALYGLISLAMRSSWHAVLGANMLLLLRAATMGSKH